MDLKFRRFGVVGPSSKGKQALQERTVHETKLHFQLQVSAEAELRGHLTKKELSKPLLTL